MATSPTNEKPANKRNVPEEPRCSVSVKNVSLTIRFELQLDTAAIPPPSPLYFSGYISELTIHGAVPMPGAYIMIYKPRKTTARNPILLGQPSVYHVLFSARHVPLTTLSSARHAPGNYPNHGDYHEPSPSIPVDKAHADNCPEGVKAGGYKRESHGCLVGCKTGKLHDGWAVVHNCVDAHELLCHLDCDARVKGTSHHVVLPRAPDLAEETRLVCPFALFLLHRVMQGLDLDLDFLGWVDFLEDGPCLVLFALIMKYI
ncbi:gamma-aminobutyraldehyde dehydrogenase [Striga asiatica]|uniref:Gamma-aminobutyraldehyde dehydrogenase n=1 Tax=Striga asiatica TaxID=4170 RepID=A0A5A7PFC2_STRAF|nr:gamma-aminobutyraldehyde dehydrogenase [Striga asiatica]